MTQYLKARHSADKKAQLVSGARTTVQTILGDIRKLGDAAIHAYSQIFDQWNLRSFRRSDVDVTACIASLPAQARIDFVTP